MYRSEPAPALVSRRRRISVALSMTIATLISATLVVTAIHYIIRASVFDKGKIVNMHYVANA